MAARPGVTLFVVAGLVLTAAPTTGQERSREFAVRRPLLSAGGSRDVIFATQRKNRVHFFDTGSLTPLGYIRVYKNASAGTAAADGRALFITQADSLDGEGCCGLFAIDLTTLEMCKLIQPVRRVAASADGHHLYGLDPGPPDGRGPVRLLKLDAVTGAVLAPRTLEADVWSISLVNIPEVLVPRGEVRTSPCTR